MSSRPLAALDYRSCSDDGRYPAICYAAATDPAVFANFRRHPDYTTILEHVSPVQGQQYYEWLAAVHAFEDKRIIDGIHQLAKPGNPKLTDYPMLGACSATALRYAKVAIEISALYPTDTFARIAEIGAGFGGQMIMLDKLFKISHYDIFDLPEANMLIERFSEHHPMNPTLAVNDIAQFDAPQVEYDLVISNYAFSELPLPLQRIYMKKVISRARHGYMAMNSGVEGETIVPNDDASAGVPVRTYSQKELLEIIPTAKIITDFPMTHMNNYLLVW